MMKNQITLKQAADADQDWILIRSSEDARGVDNRLVLPLALWLESGNSYAHRTDIAIWLDSHEEPESIAADLENFQFIALNFPSYRDGRPYSSASILRGRLGYTGQLHAIGDVRLDQLEEMRRCGFNVFHGEDGILLDPNLVSRFSCQYQASADQGLPLFRTALL